MGHTLLLFLRVLHSPSPQLGSGFHLDFYISDLYPALSLAFWFYPTSLSPRCFY